LVAALVVSFLLCASGVGEASPAALEFPFQLRGGLIWIEVQTPASAEPLNFMVDSGAQASVINLGVARRLRLKLGEPVSVQGVESKAGGFWPEHLRARAGDVVLPKDYLAVDLGALSRACGCGVDGLLGADFFKGRRVQIDFRDRKIRLLNSPPAAANAASIPLETRPSGMLVEIQVNNNPLQKVRLDTGCASPLQWTAGKDAGGPCSEQIAVGVAAVSMPLITTTVHLGGNEFNAVPTGLHVNPIFPGEAGLLGAPLLSRFGRVTVDGVAGRLFLQK
jgi:hypothetical protein